MDRQTTDYASEQAQGQGRFRDEVLNCKILIVEDSLLDRALLSKVFRREGFRNIVEAENGRDGLNKLYSFRPDLIIADIKMPEMDGFELCRRIRDDADPALARVPILIQTALKQMRDKAFIFAAGASDYLTKPVDPTEVIARGVMHLERELILRRLHKFNTKIAEERDPFRTAPSHEAQGEAWSFKRLSATINVLLDEIERNHGELIQARDRAEQADQMKTEFLANVTHELKVPVHCILNYVQIAHDDCAKGDLAAVRSHLSDITSNGQRLDLLVSDLLDFSRIETGNMDLNLGRFSVRDMVAQSVAFTSRMAEGKQLTVKIGDTLQDDHVMVDRRRAEQVFVNLMSNAIRFSPEGGTIRWAFAPATVTLSEFGEIAPAVAITVHDEGAGIAPGDLEKIFDPFVQGKDVMEGTGLGLAICRRLLRLVHGSVEARNAPDKGAVFEVKLPLAAAFWGDTHG